MSKIFENRLRFDKVTESLKGELFGDTAVCRPIIVSCHNFSQCAEKRSCPMSSRTLLVIGDRSRITGLGSGRRGSRVFFRISNMGGVNQTLGVPSFPFPFPFPSPTVQWLLSLYPVGGNFFLNEGFY